MREPNDEGNLSVRAAGVLCNAGLLKYDGSQNLREHVRTMVLENKVDLRKVRQCGPKTLREICDWADIPHYPGIRKPFFCPHCHKEI